MCRYADKNALSIDVLAAAWQEPSAWQGTTDLGVTLTNEVWGRIALTESSELQHALCQFRFRDPRSLAGQQGVPGLIESCP